MKMVKVIPYLNLPKSRYKKYFYFSRSNINSSEFSILGSGYWWSSGFENFISVNKGWR